MAKLADLIEATRAEDLPAVIELLPQVDNVNEMIDGRRVLADAIQARDIEILKAFLTSGKFDLELPVATFESLEARNAKQGDCFSRKCVKLRKNKTIDQSITPLFMAIEAQSAEAIELLLKSGANFDTKTPITDMSLLMAACFTRQISVIKAVAENVSKLNPNELNKHGKTALDFLLSSEVLPLDSYFKINSWNPPPIPSSASAPLDAEHNFFTYVYAEIGCNQSGDPNFDFFDRLCQFGKGGLVMESIRQSIKIPLGRTPLCNALRYEVDEALLNILINDENIDFNELDEGGVSFFDYAFGINLSKDWVFQNIAMSENHFLGYLKNGWNHDIKDFEMIIAKYPHFENVAMQFFEEFGWKRFFKFFKKAEVDEFSKYYQRYLKNLLVRDEQFKSFFKICSHFSLKEIIESLNRDKQYEFIEQMIDKRELVTKIAWRHNFFNVQYLTEAFKFAPFKMEWIPEKIEHCIICKHLKNVDLSIENIADLFSRFSTSCPECLSVLIGKANALDAALSTIFPLQKLIEKPLLPHHRRILNFTIYSNVELFNCLKSCDNIDIQVLLFELLKNKLSTIEGFCVFNFKLFHKRFISVLLRCNIRKEEVVEKLTDKQVFEFQTLTPSRRLNLFVRMVRYLPFDLFMQFLAKVEEMKPGYFQKKIIKPYGAYLLCKAQRLDICIFLIVDCKVSPNGRVHETQGTYSPLCCALLKRNYKKALCLLAHGASIQNLTHGQFTIFAKLVEKSFELKRFWTRTLFKNSTLSFIYLALLIRKYSGNSLLGYLPFGMPDIQLKTHHIQQLIYYALKDGKSDAAAYIYEKWPVDCKLLCSPSCQSLLDIAIEKQDCNFLKKSKQQGIKETDIYNTKKSDGTYLLHEMSFMQFKHSRFAFLLEHFKELKFCFITGPGGVRTFSSIDCEKEILADSLSCSICRESYEATSEVAIFKCKHAFHYACIISYTIANNSCPFCLQMF